MPKSLLVALITIIFALPAMGYTYKSTYAVACDQLWPAVKVVLSNPDNYAIESSDDAQMNAAYQVKHAVHANVSGALLQRTNHVKLVTKGTGCEMRVGSNYSGWEHNDRGDFKQRVDESLAKLDASKPPKPAEPAK
jgi:hypothetical protein